MSEGQSPAAERAVQAPGEGAGYRRPITIYTVAERAGVSIATVSRVLQGSVPVSATTRARVMAAVHELGYVPLRAGRSSALRLEAHGVVLPSIGGPYYSDLLLGLESTAGAFGQSTTLVSAESTPDLDDRVLDLAAKVDGMVIGHATVSDDVVRQVARMVPVVLVAREPIEGCDQVAVDNTTSALELVRHVIGHGATRLRFVGDPESSRDVMRRYEGFRRALAEAGLDEAPGPVRVPYVEDAARVIVEALEDELSTGDALICANDELALATTQILVRRGIRVPQDVLVTGWDDIMPARYTVPGLTTVRQPVRELGRLLSQRLHDRIANGVAVQEPLTIPSEVVIRGTCGCPELLHE